MSKVKVAVIGYGVWGKQHARVYNELRDSCELVALCDSDPNRLVEASNLYPFARLHPELASLIDDREVDAVSICIPAADHFEAAEKLLRSGKHLLIEKPVTLFSSDAEKLVDVQKESGKVVQVGFIERFNPAVCKAVELLREGWIGKVKATSHRRLSGRPTRISDVGVVLDLMIHEWDIANLLAKNGLGSIGRIQGEDAFVEEFHYESHAASVFKYSHFATGVIEASWLSPRKVRKLTVIGEEGVINVDYMTQDVTVQRGQDNRQIWFHKDEPLRLELSAFLDNIGRGYVVQPGLREGVEALKLCEAYKDAVMTAVGQTVK